MTARLIFVLLSGALYWQGVVAISGANEPWDAAKYWTVWYPGSVVLAVIAAYAVARLRWRAGASLVGMQLPVLWANATPGALWPAGLLILAVLTAPAMALSALAGMLGDRRRAV